MECRERETERKKWSAERERQTDRETEINTQREVLTGSQLCLGQEPLDDRCRGSSEGDVQTDGLPAPNGDVAGSQSQHTWRDGHWALERVAPGPARP